MIAPVEMTSEQVFQIAQNSLNASEKAHTALLEIFSVEKEALLSPQERIEFLQAKAKAFSSLREALDAQQNLLALYTGQGSL